jgi:hypothetical protein
MKRQNYNYKILETIQNKLPEFEAYYDEIENYIEKCPQQRFGQILCNYICWDYRDKQCDWEHRKLLNTIFPNNPDPFFEESSETYLRLNEE